MKAAHLHSRAPAQVVLPLAHHVGEQQARVQVALLLLVREQTQVQLLRASKASSVMCSVHRSNHRAYAYSCQPDAHLRLVVEQAVQVTGKQKRNSRQQLAVVLEHHADLRGERTDQIGGRERKGTERKAHLTAGKAGQSSSPFRRVAAR